MATTKTQSFAGYVEVTSNLSVDTDTLHVDSVSNRVGIGKTNPQYELDIAGSINATDLYVSGTSYSSSPWSSNNANTYYTSGNIGISTDTPTEQLDICGPLNLSNASAGASTSFYSIYSAVNTTTPSASTMPFQGIWAEYNAIRISADTSYLIVGNWGLDGSSSSQTDRGGVSLFTRSGSSWANENQFFGTQKYQRVGWSVDISNDGSYAIAGHAYENDPAQSPGTYRGSVHVYERSGTTWTDTTTLRAPPSYQFVGMGCSINHDGTIIVASSGNNSKIIQWTRSGSTWTYETDEITPETGYVAVGLKNNLRLSKDSDTKYLVVGDNQRDTAGGSVFVYSRSGTTWTLESELEASDKSPNYNNGISVDISNDTSYIISGSNQRTPTGGAAYIYKRTGSDWTSYTEDAILSSPTGSDFGQCVSISDDGTHAAVGAPGELGNRGAYYIYNNDVTPWTLGTRHTNPSPTTYDLGRGVYTINTPTGYYYAATMSTYTAFSVIEHNASYPTTLIVDNQIKADGTVLSFTGQHRCFPDGPLSQGQIVSANKNKYISLNGPLTTGSQAIKSSESLPMVSLSNVVNDTTVFGVVDHIENNESVRSQESGIGVVTQDKELGDNRVVVNSLGEGAIWVVNTNGNLASGDYITTSNVTGYGQKQDDSDTLHSYTVAKITMDCDFNPQDVPIQVIKKDENGQNILDSYGRLQWEDTDEMEPAYSIIYITTDGDLTDEVNAAWKAAYVGCTYHCG